VDSGAKRRWTVLGILMLATLVAIAYPVDEEGATFLPVRSSIVTVAKPSDLVVPPTVDSLEWVATEVDPFAIRSWTPAVPTQVEAVAVPREVAPVVVAVPSGPPALPYKFIGQMDSGGELLLYLGRGDQVHLAKVGDTIDGLYKIVQVSKTQIEFELVATSERQSLLIPQHEN